MYPFDSKGLRRHTGPFAMSPDSRDRSMAVMPAPVMHLRMSYIGIVVLPGRIAAVRIGIAWPQILAIGVRIVLGATAGIRDHRLRLRRAHQRRCRDSRGTQQSKFHSFFS